MWFKTKEKNYWNQWAEFPDDKHKLIVTDNDIWMYVKKHTRFIDRLDGRKVVEAAQYAFSILSKSIDPPKNPNFIWRWPYRED